MNAINSDIGTGTQEKHVLLPLIYFDIFTYPLTKEEIVRFSPGSVSADIDATLSQLERRGIVFRFGDYYSLKNEIGPIDRRIAGNQLAEKKLATARRFGRLMSAFPFVRAVMLSGSISKGYMDSQSDIDYFIITKSGKLWLVRTAFALFRRVFLFNSHKNFCTNYFIGDQALEIGEKNMFTAVETSTLKPVYGKHPVYEFQAANSWCTTFLPNRRVENGLGDESDFFLKKISERILSLSMFDRLDQWLMERSIIYWKKRYGSELNESDFRIAFQSTKEVSRSHPAFYQKKVLSRFSEKIRLFEREQGITLST